MFKFEVQGVSVQPQNVALHGCWDLGHSKRFQVILVPIEHFTCHAVLEALCEAAAAVPDLPDDEWKQFLLFG